MSNDVLANKMVAFFLGVACTVGTSVVVNLLYEVAANYLLTISGKTSGSVGNMVMTMMMIPIFAYVASQLVGHIKVKDKLISGEYQTPVWTYVVISALLQMIIGAVSVVVFGLFKKDINLSLIMIVTCSVVISSFSLYVSCKMCRSFR